MATIEINLGTYDAANEVAIGNLDGMKITVDDKGYDTLVLGGSTLTIRDDSQSALDGGLSFKISTGVSYTYDKSTKKFTAKA